MSQFVKSSTLQERKSSSAKPLSTTANFNANAARAAVADLQGLAESLGYSRIGPEPVDHIVALVGLMAHVTTLEAEAITRNEVGEAMYLEGIAEWLRRGHLAWFADQITRAMRDTDVCYLSHVAYALEARILPPGKKARPIPRPSGGPRDDPT